MKESRRLTLEPTLGGFQSIPQRCAVVHQNLNVSSVDSIPDDMEEVLMKVTLVTKDSKYSESDILEKVFAYVASFPFSAVLPVQPLTYTPRKDGRGVDVTFLRKKTQEKGSVDGGMTFLLSSEREGGMIITAKRKSEGQVISKVFSEGMVINAFVSGLWGEEGGRVGLGYDELMNMISVESVVHKWM